MNPESPTPLVPLARGNRYSNRYVLKRRLGLGRLGEVWLADDTRLEMDVALKFFDQPEHRALLESVARKCMKLMHPNLVRVYDFIDDAQGCALVMEYIEGGSLARRLKERETGCMEPAEIQDWVKQLWSGLAELHEQGVVHGNLNLANMAIAGGGELKIMEAGFFEVRAATVNTELTFSFLPCLTPQILSGKAPGVMDDTYAAGACVYELLTGKPVFLGGNLPNQIQERPITPVAVRRAELGLGTQPVPEDWEQWIARCLGKSPYDRPHSTEMRDWFRDAPPVSIVTAEEAAAAMRKAASPAARIASASAHLRTVPKQAWYGVAATVALMVFYFTTWQPAQKALATMEAAFNEIRIQKATEPPATQAKLWQDFQINFAQPIAFTERDAQMMTDALRLQMGQQQAADELRRTAQAEVERKERELETRLDKLTETFSQKLEHAKTTTEDRTVPADEHLETWQNFMAEYDLRIAEFKDAADLPVVLKQMRKVAEERIAFWSQEQMRQDAAYASYRQKLSNEVARLSAIFPDTTKGAAYKQAEIQKGRAALGPPPLTTQTQHLALIGQLEGWSKDWSEKAAAEAPPAPLPLKDLFAQTSYKDLSEEQLKALLAKVYKGYNIDPAEDPDRMKLHQAILAKQRQSLGVLSGRLDLTDLAKAELPPEMDADALTKLTASLTTANTPSQPRRSSSGGSRGKKKTPEKKGVGENLRDTAKKGLNSVKNLFGGKDKK